MGAKLNMDTGGEIINCAAKLFAKRGVGSVSLRDIADELGISKGTLHYYFKTKEDLICSCAEKCRTPFQARRGSRKKTPHRVPKPVLQNPCVPAQ